MSLRKIPFVNKKYYSKVVSGYAQKFKMAEPSNNPYSSEDDEYSDASEVAASAGASIIAKFVLFEFNHVVIAIESYYRESDFHDFMIWVERESVLQY